MSDRQMVSWVRKTGGWRCGQGLISHVLIGLLKTLAFALHHPGLGERSEHAMAVLQGSLWRPWGKRVEPSREAVTSIGER